MCGQVPWWMVKEVMSCNFKTAVVYNLRNITDRREPVYPYRHIFNYLCSGCTVAAPERTTWKNGRNTLQPWVNNSLTLNLIVCRKRQLNLGRISLLKRKAQHRRKRIQRKKHGKVKTQSARFTAPGFFLLTRVSRSGLSLWFKCTYLPKPAPFHKRKFQFHVPGLCFFTAS